MAAMRTTTMMVKLDLAQCILAMSYGELRNVGAELASTCEDKEARPKMETTEDFAELLYDWAAATVEGSSSQSSHRCTMVTQHASDCAVHNAPALPIGPCDCGASIKHGQDR
jgi:hypothetical protein